MRNKALHQFRRKVRKGLDKGTLDPAVAGLFLDVYEVFCILAEELQKEQIAEEIASSIMGGPFGPGKMVKLSPEEFDKVVKRDKEGKAKGPEAKGTGQYL